MTIKELEAEIAKLRPKELEEFRAWFEQFDAKAWDEQIEEDVASGNSTTWPRTHCATTGKGNALTCEAPRQSSTPGQVPYMTT